MPASLIAALPVPESSMSMANQVERSLLYTAIAWFLGLILVAVCLVYLPSPFRRWLLRRFHARRVRVYFGQTHPRRHAKENVRQPDVVVPEPFEIVRCSYAPRGGEDATLSGDDGTIRVVTWNIEFGYRLELLIAALRQLRADVICLQEVDICGGEHAPVSVDSFRSIARALGMNGCFAPHHGYSFVFPAGGTAAASGGARGRGRGVWGCAVLSRFPIVAAEQVPLFHLENYPRSALLTEVRLPASASTSSSAGGRGGGRVVRVVSAHLEVCCGISHRARQFRAIVDRIAALDRQQQEQDQTSSGRDRDRKDGGRGASAARKPVILCGDLNTVAHKISRISPVHCADNYRWRSCGRSEPRWWQDHLLSEPACRGFADPFDKESNTLRRPWYIPSKLDWVLLRDLRAVRWSIGSGDESDHYHLVCDVAVDELS